VSNLKKNRMELSKIINSTLNSKKILIKTMKKLNIAIINLVITVIENEIIIMIMTTMILQIISVTILKNIIISDDYLLSIKEMEEIINIIH